MTLLRARGLFALLLVSAAPLALANHDTTSPVLNVDTDTGYSTISAALAAANPYETIVVRPGTYVEQISIHTPVTLCSTTAGGFACADQASSTVIQGSSIYPVWIDAHAVTFRGFTVDNSLFTTVDQDFGPIDPSLVVVYGGADDVIIQNNVLRNPTAPHGPGESVWLTQGVNVIDAERTIIQGNTFQGLTSSRGPDGTCANDPCRTTAILLGEIAQGYGGGHYVKDNTINLPTGSIGGPAESVGVGGITANLEMTGNTISLDTGAAPSGFYGVFGIFRSSTFDGNTISGGQHGIFLRTMVDAMHNVVHANTFQANNEGLRNYARDTEVTENRFLDNNIAVRLAGNILTTGTSEGLVFKDNLMAGNGRTLSIHAEVTNLDVDATYNNWGTYSRAAIESQLEDLGTGNSIDVTCWYDVDGTTPICPPTAAFTYLPLAPHRLDEVDFTDASVDGGRAITSHAWNFGDGATSTDASPSHTYSTSGVKTVTHTVTDTEGYTDTTSQMVAVSNAAPILSALPPVTIGEGTLLQQWIHASDPDGDSILYSITGRPAGATFGAFPNGSAFFSWRPGPNAAGSYAVSFGATDGELSDTEVLSITVSNVNRAPIAAISGPNLLRVGQTASWSSLATDPDGDGLTLAWTFGDTGAAAGSPVAHAYATAGAFTLTLTATDTFGASTSATKLVTVDGTAPTTTVTPSATQAAPGWYAGPVSFALAATDAGGAGVLRVQYSADGGPLTTYNGNPIAFSADGPHTLRFYATDRVGNAESATVLAFGIDSVAPTLTISSADGRMPTPVLLVTGDGIISDSFLDFTGTATDALSGVARVELVVDGSVVASQMGGGAFTLAWNHFGAAPGVHQARVRAIDVAGHATEELFLVVKGTRTLG